MEPTFRDLTTFVEEKANEYSSKYGQFYAEAHNATLKSRTQDNFNKPKERKRNVTTLATSTSGGEASAAGPELESTCASTSTSHDTKNKCFLCDKAGHYIGTCYRFKKLSLQDKRDAVKKHNLCFCCLKPGHGSATCGKGLL